MMPGVVAGFPSKPQVPTSELIPKWGAGWSVGSPAPLATRLGTTVTLSGKFIASNVQGSGDQQNAGVLPAGYRPGDDLTFPVMVGSTATTLTIQHSWGGLNITLVGALNGTLDLTGISFSTT